jgi:hypothetical protein
MAWGEIDCCPHCSYWLIDLRGSGEAPINERTPT